MMNTDEFIEQIIMTAIPDIDEKELEMMVEETQPILYDRVISRITDKIDPKDGQKILDILEAEGITPEVTKYLEAKIPDLSKFLKNIYNDFETTYLKQFKSFEKEFPPEDIEEKE